MSALVFGLASCAPRPDFASCGTDLRCRAALAACEAHDDSDACHLDGLSGTCESGTCVTPDARTCFPTREVCNALDDDCNGLVDDGITCEVCVPEVCNGRDDNCDGLIDNGITCDDWCVPEVCNGIDDNCDGLIDNGITC